MLIAIQYDVRKVQSNCCGYVWNRMCGDTGISGQPVSYTHLDVYKRQVCLLLERIMVRYIRIDYVRRLLC